MAKIKNTDRIEHWRGWEATGILTHYWQISRIRQPLWITVWRFLKNYYMSQTCHSNKFNQKKNESICPQKTGM